MQILLNEITLAIYTNVSRGLFEKHKLVFSFMLNIAIDMNDEIVSLIQWNFLLRGPTRIVVVSYMFCLKDYNYNKNIIKYLNFK